MACAGAQTPQPPLIRPFNLQNAAWGQLRPYLARCALKLFSIFYLFLSIYVTYSRTSSSIWVRANSGERNLNFINAMHLPSVTVNQIKSIFLQLAQVVLFILLTTFASVAHADEPRLDGLFLEWSSANLIATDPSGDATGAFDIQKVYATNRGTRLFLRFDIGSTLNMQSGLTTDGTLIAQIAMPNGKFLSMDMRNKLLWRDNDPLLTVTNESVNYAVAPSYASNEFELAIDLSAFGVVLGSPITINFSSSDSLASAAAYTMSQSEIVAARRSANRTPGTTFRIASLNTYATGLLNSTQRPQIQRLVDAMNADIYCFQEEFNSYPEDIAQALAEANPMEDGATWNVSQYYDMAIASRSPIISLSNSSGRKGVIVDLPGEGPEDAVVIFSIHPKCCGYIGDSNDVTRISQMNSLITRVTDLRAGKLGSQYEQYRQAPIIIIGDWNLVGSRTPLDLVTDPAGLHMVDAMPAHLIGEDVMTWRTKSGETFCPGRLDLMAYQDMNGLDLLGSFILDSALLNSSELSALDLLSTDSSCSDHLMLVGDFVFSSGTSTCVSDLDGSGLVDSADVALVLLGMGECSHCAEDLDGSGLVDSADVALVLLDMGNCPVSQPTISAVNPNTGTTTGATAITITGKNLTGATSVTVGGVAASYVVVSANTITAISPAHSVGAVDIVVVTPNGTATLVGAFTYFDSSWYTILEQDPNAAVVPDSAVRAKIVASGFPWRVRDNSSGIEMLLIPGGTFTMGCSPSNIYDCYSDENPTHQVTLSKAFYLGKTEVTQAQWQAKMGSNPSYFKSYSDSPSRPVEKVSWNDITGFNTATGLRLPTEAEWEYACRGGTTTAFHSMPGYPNGTNDDSLLGFIAWFYPAAANTTRAVAGKAANAFGMYDMSGNVWEWCNDWYGSYAAGNATDPAGPSTGTYRVLRGGAWNSYPGSGSCRSSGRSGYVVPVNRGSNIGFRVARTP